MLACAEWELHEGQTTLKKVPNDNHGTEECSNFTENIPRKV
jgi:hypothetical protein